MPDLPPLTRTALKDSELARRLYRDADATEQNARRQGDTASADMWKAIAAAWLKAHQTYHRAHEYFLRYELSVQTNAWKGEAGHLANRAAEGYGRCADSLQLAAV